MQSRCTSFPIWNQSVVPCPVLTVESWPAYRLFRRQVRWSGIPISFQIYQFIVLHTVKGFGIVNKAEVDVYLELCCFFNDPADVGNLISGSSAFSNTRLNIWKFTVHILLNPGLENFEHYFTSMWDESFFNFLNLCLWFYFHKFTVNIEKERGTKDTLILETSLFSSVIPHAPSNWCFLYIASQNRNRSGLLQGLACQKCSSHNLIFPSSYQNFSL